MQKLFDQEAGKYGVYPLDDRFVERTLIQSGLLQFVAKAIHLFSRNHARLPEGSAQPICRAGVVLRLTLSFLKAVPMV